jgi:Fur family transcriptional regulator, ferric uptake regulator
MWPAGPAATSDWSSAPQAQADAHATRRYTGCMAGSTDTVLELLRSRGLRMTPQRRAIVAEVMAAEGHISPAAVARRVQERVPGVNASTVYRTLDVLEDLGVLSHAHLESGPEYHRSTDGQHVHLTCARCGAGDSLSLKEADRLKQLIVRHHGFSPDLTHFAISGLCADCQRKRRR